MAGHLGGSSVCDLVIVGGAPAGRAAAAHAVQAGARVALVEPVDAPDRLGWATLLAARPDLPTAPLPRQFAWAIARQQEEADRLAALGVDGVVAPTIALARSRRGSWRVEAGDRAWQTRRILLAPPGRSRLPLAWPGAAGALALRSNIAHDSRWGGLEQVSAWLRAGQLQEIAGERWLLVGGTLGAIELAQAVARLGGRVRLVVDSLALATTLDRRCSDWLQTVLEAAGVEVARSTRVEEVARRESSRSELAVQLTGYPEPVGVDRLVVAAADQPSWPELGGLGLAVGARGLATGADLQTRAPGVYACGAALGGEDRLDLAVWEARRAVAHALGWPWARGPAVAPAVWRLAIDPSLVAIGAALAAVTPDWGDRVGRCEELAWPDAVEPGWVRLVLGRGDRLVGALVAGRRAAVVVPLLAAAVQRGWRESEVVASLARFH